MVCDAASDGALDGHVTEEREAEADAARPLAARPAEEEDGAPPPWLDVAGDGGVMLRVIREGSGQRPGLHAVCMGASRLSPAAAARTRMYG